MTPPSRASCPTPAAARWARLRSALATFAAALTAAFTAACTATLLAACGPGVGGTGTGTSLTPEQALAAFGASAAPLCASALVPPLQCSTLPGTATAPGPAPVQLLADDPVAARAVARVAGDAIELELPCEQLRFSGTWGAVPGQPARFYGVVQRSVDGTTLLATLSAQPAGSGIATALADTDGKALAPPRQLQPVPAAPAAACRG